MSRLNRRTFLKGSAAVVAAGSLPAAKGSGPEILVRRPHPCVVSSSNGHRACTTKAMEMIIAGKPVVEAVVEGVTLVENDPKDTSVGYGGLPNENGVVELDSSVMDGNSCLAGAVASIRDIKNPARVALNVLRYTDHCLLVGEGAKKFAVAHGFKEENLLTERARKIWLRWKTTLSDRDDWFPKDNAKLDQDVRKAVGHYGTINCNAVNSEGDLAGVTTTRSSAPDSTSTTISGRPVQPGVARRTSSRADLRPSSKACAGACIRRTRVSSPPRTSFGSPERSTSFARTASPAST
jgi:N4-(beta-N-acetylglucosaminyl)-L-asparaginase